MKNLTFLWSISLLVAVALACSSTVETEKPKKVQSLEMKESSSPVVISEFMASNKTFLETSKGKYSDWLELHNTSKDSVKLAGYFLSDNKDKPEKLDLTGIIMAPNEYRIFISSNTKNDSLSLPFKLDKDGGKIIISSPKTGAKFKVDYPSQVSDHSYQMLDGAWFYTESPSPGLANESKENLKGIAEPVQISFLKKGKQYEVRMTSSHTGEIRYDLYGDRRKLKSNIIYKKPFLIDSAQVVSAAVQNKNYIPRKPNFKSPVSVGNHSLPIISLTTDPKNLWSDSTGIYVQGLFNNYEDRSDSCERSGSLTFYRNGEEVELPDVSFKIYGAGTRKRPKKSMTVKPAGDKMPNYFFSSRGEEFIDGFVLRACYSDASRFKNEVVNQVNKKVNSALLMQDYEHVVLYLNGEYWGLFNLYERKNDDFIKAHSGKKVKHLLNANSSQAKVEKGSAKSYNLFLDEINAVDIKSKAAFELISRHFEVGSLIDFWVQELYTLKPDRFNNRFWKTKGEDAKWAYVGYDFDIGFIWPDNPKSKRHFTSKEAKGVSIFNRCIQNPDFAQLFFTRLNDFINFGYTTENVAEILELTDSLTKDEFKRDYERWSVEWPKCKDDGDSQKKRITKFIAPRNEYLRDSIFSMFGYTQPLLIKNLCSANSGILINGLELTASAVYHKGMEITIGRKSHTDVPIEWFLNGNKIRPDSTFSITEGGLLEVKCK